MEENNKQATLVKEKICKQCGKPFYVSIHSYARPRYCSDECRQQKKIKDYESLITKKAEIKNNLFKDKILGRDYVECPICHEKYKQLSPFHFKKHGYENMAQVKKDFPDTQLTCEDLIENVLMGQNNPMSKSNRTEIQRKQASPYSIQHYIKKCNGDIDLAKQQLNNFLKNIDRSNWLENTRIEYYLAKGLSEEDAILALKERQTTNGEKSYIKRYGEEKGKELFSKRMENWCKNTFTGKSRSSIADQCIQEIIEDNNQYMWYGENEYVCKSSINNKTYKIDLTNTNNNRMIEFFGDYWHCNPKKYGKEYIRKKRWATAEEVWKYDKERLECLSALGYDVMVIWEYDYKHDHDNVIKKAKEFIFWNNE